MTTTPTPKVGELKAQGDQDLPAGVDDNLPSYTQNPSDDQLPPETLLLAGDAIHSASRPASCSIPLYKLSLDISFLRKNNTKVELSRFEHRIHSRNSSPEVSARPRHIFNLTRPPTVTTPSFEYHLESVSNSNLGHIGLKRYHHIFSSGYQAWKATIAHPGANLLAKDIIFIAKTQHKGRHKVRHEWREAGDSGQILAYDIMDDGIFYLEIIKTMPQNQRDTLVGAWCLRVWRDIANSNIEPLTWNEVKRILGTRTTEFPLGTGWGM
ncbi:hypothetical protein MGYG_02923 [Nannizzia gypsea CBS 118893]|uniref:Uncharacterized protein n=1 Tax=Arthroderma gypseum (strain ATCC MYA-4604 / CBS 118893) TaxID=535722 RepID=E4UPU3_ARTGP|nr:hypothetical protein MGYG_02923 [Nannizzia gypsea CBS 118893]EFQ99915.1 hypothetical protein MGYG_02923 [Nannizzia gypsea CBS 118893]